MINDVLVLVPPMVATGEAVAALALTCAESGAGASTLHIIAHLREQTETVERGRNGRWRQGHAKAVAVQDGATAAASGARTGVEQDDKTI